MATVQAAASGGADDSSNCNCLVLRHRRHVQVAVCYAHDMHAMEVLHFPDEDRYAIRVINTEGEYCKRCVRLSGRYLRKFEVDYWRSASLSAVQRCFQVLSDPRSPGQVSYLLEHPLTTLRHLLTIIEIKHGHLKRSEEPLPEHLIWKTLMELLQALAWAARAKVTFGGLTAERVLIFADGCVKIENGLYYLNMPAPTAGDALTPRGSSRVNAAAADLRLDCYNPIAWTWTVGGIGVQAAVLRQSMPDRVEMDSLCNSSEFVLPRGYSVALEQFVRRCMEYGRFHYEVRKRSVSGSDLQSESYDEVVPTAVYLRKLHRVAERQYHCHMGRARFSYASLVDYLRFLEKV